MRKTTKIFAVLASLLLAVGVAACDDDNEAKVKEKGDGSAKIVDSDNDEAAEPAAEDDNAAQLGDTVELGDWEVKVTNVQLNGNETIQSANEFNEKPKGQYVLATYEATYVGDDRTSDTMFELTWTYTGSDNQVYEPAPAVTPGDEWPSEARSGGTVKQDAAFDVPKKAIKGGTLSVETYDDELENIYADFAVN